MVETSDSTSKNKQFLQQFEQQRLNRICNRAIDLRGKVAGECQAYTFGGKTHYLDDRGFLLAKQLLDHFHGKYTIGVYEAVLKALKTLKQQSESQSTDYHSEKEILLQDPQQAQLISFDQLLQRKEARIVFVTAVSVTMDEMLYHGSTIDITTSAIRITLQRTHTLEQGDTVNINFLDFNAPSDSLAKVPYKIIKIDHDTNRTFVILARHRDDNIAVTNWLDNWSQKHSTPKYLDLDYELFNLASRYYLRMYSQTLKTPLLWLSNSNSSGPIQAFQLMPNGEKTLSSLFDNNNNVDLSLLPLHKLIETTQDHLVVIYRLDGRKSSIAVPRNNSTLVAKALKWQRQVNGTVLLLQSKNQTINPDEFTNQIARISKRDESVALDLIRRLKDITQLITISDISTSCKNLDPISMLSDDEIERYTVIPQAKITLPTPNQLTHSINRKEQRFFIRTPITIHIDNKIINVTTRDASSTGLSFTPPKDLILSSNMHIAIDFNRWQSQTRVKLSNIPFIVKNNKKLFGQTSIGLERISLGCSQKVNDFFTNIIEKNKDDLAKNNLDIITSQETYIFSSILSKSLATIPLYFGMDKNNKRILQAIASTQYNHAQDLKSLWLSLVNIATFLSEMIKSTGSIECGLYCYQNKTTTNEWIINTDYELLTATQKSIFINRALTMEKHLFFHLSLTPIQFNTLNEEKDLYDQLSQLRPHSPHKVKQINDILHSLFAVGELTDITDIIKSTYL